MKRTGTYCKARELNPGDVFIFKNQEWKVLFWQHPSGPLYIDHGDGVLGTIFHFYPDRRIRRLVG